MVRIYSVFYAILLAFLTACAGGSPAEDPAPAPNPGPGGNEIPNLDQDPVLSFKLYIGTFAGLVIQNYQNGDLVSSTPIANWEVQSLNDIDGNLYVGTTSGLYVSPINAPNWTHISAANGLESYSIKDAVKQGSSLWVAHGAGLSKSTDLGLSFSQIDEASGIESGGAEKIRLFGSNGLVVAKNSGLFMSIDSGDSFQQKKNIYAFDVETVGTYESGVGAIFAGSVGGISRSIDSGASFNDLSFEGHIKMTRDLEWISSSQRLAAIVGYENSDNDRLILCLTPLALDPQCQDVTGVAQLYGESMTSLESDASNLYVGTYNGLIRLDLSQFPTISSQRFGTSDGLPSDDITEILASGSQLFVGTDEGLARWNSASNRFDEWSPQRRLGSNMVFDTEFSSDGSLWIGTGRGLTRVFTDGSFSRPAGLLNEASRSIEVSSTDQFFVGTKNGIFKSNDYGVSWVQYTTAYGLASNWINQIFIHQNGDLYAATSAGLSRLKSGASDFESLLSEKIWDVRLTPEGKLLVATESGFKVSSDGGASFQEVHRSNDYSEHYVEVGLGDDIVYSLFDFGGRIFAGTNGGLSLSDDGGVSFVNKHRDHGLLTPNTYDVSALGGTVAVATSYGAAVSIDNANSFVIVPTPSHQALSVRLK